MFGSKSIKIKGADCGVDALFLAIITCIGGFLFGYDIGQISGILLYNDFIYRFLWGSTATVKSLLVSFMGVGCLFGSLIGAYTTDFLGRRKSIALAVALYITGDIVQVTAKESWIHITIGRFVSGLGMGNLSVGVPMFQSECAPRQIRGAVVASYQLLITIGILFGNVVCYLMRPLENDSYSWRIIIGLGAVFSLPLGLGILFVPESPRWLAGRDNHDQGNVIVENDMHEMKEVLALEQQSGRASWAECFSGKAKVPKTRYRTFLGMGIHFLQQWTGINYFFYYGATVFASAKIKDPLMTQLILGAINVATSFSGVYFVDRLGRRWPLILGALWQSVWLLIFASIGAVSRRDESSPAFGIAMIVAACMFIASFAATWGPIAWVVMGETFALRTRAKQASLVTAANWTGNFLIGLLTPHADHAISYSFGFILAGMNLIAAAVVWLFLYESSLLSLENVDIMYSIQDLSPWKSAQWVPPGYLTRLTRDEQHFRGEMVEMAGKDGDVKPDVKSDGKNV
ncbi:general substrate transporter [Trichoderma citrinoviride]|uniref:General substrate transporter n=1 Tax=Trichoderma citrinoviride TaxID=58853 RepID=A0A2T4BCC5_9HYPO|nr:general substrate transporter [Trichoderma citrinoviride]PTB66849.1 general substrate transporter [Trichoderma citrinoviride]